MDFGLTQGVHDKTPIFKLSRYSIFRGSTRRRRRGKKEIKVYF